GVVVDFAVDRGRGTVYREADGRRQPLAFTPVRVTVGSAQLRATSQNLVESRRRVDSTVRFPLLGEHEAEGFEVAFADTAAAEDAGFRLHFERFPSVATVYVDRNGNDAFDPGEETNPDTGVGYNGVEVVMNVTGFERVVVSDRDGQVRTPLFTAPVVEGAAAEEA